MTWPKAGHSAWKPYPQQGAVLPTKRLTGEADGTTKGRPQQELYADPKIPTVPCHLSNKEYQR